jgi:hypothetical protein
MQIGNPRWGLDNWIYCNYALGEITGSQTQAKVTVPRGEFKFHPLTGQFGPASGVGQFGNTIDRWGRRFFTSNRNPVMTEILSWEIARRNPHYLLPTTHYDVVPAGDNSLVFPLIEMKSNYLSHSGTHTAACGATAYLGPLGDAGFHESVFVCEPIGHLVTRSIIKSRGAELTSDRAQDKADFLVSIDPWFRPASLATGPDGGLYLADMYRLWVEHPKFLPEDVAAQLDWRAGDDLGRIWRIVPENESLEVYQPPKTDGELINQLASSSPWQRYTAQRLIVELKDKLDEIKAGYVQQSGHIGSVSAVQNEELGQTNSSVQGTGTPDVVALEEALQALSALGYKNRETEQIKQKLMAEARRADEPWGTEQYIKSGLALLNQSG